MRICSYLLRLGAAWEKAKILKSSQHSTMTRYMSVSSQTAISQKEVVEEQKPTFASLLRKSAFIQMGQHKNVPIVGKVFQVQDSNIYIDFGGKFHCVCDLHRYVKNEANKAQYRRGKYVVIKLLDFELSARFLGATQDTTLLEADADLLGLYEDYVKERGKSASLIRPFKEIVTKDELEVDQLVDDEESNEYEQHLDTASKYFTEEILTEEEYDPELFNDFDSNKQVKKSNAKVSDAMHQPHAFAEGKVDESLVESMSSIKRNTKQSRSKEKKVHTFDDKFDENVIENLLEDKYLQSKQKSKNSDANKAQSSEETNSFDATSGSKTNRNERNKKEDCEIEASEKENPAK